MARKVTVIPASQTKSTVSAEGTGKTRVAAYCRVSTDTEDQKTSFEGQVKHYTELIGANPDGIFGPQTLRMAKAFRK